MVSEVVAPVPGEFEIKMTPRKPKKESFKAFVLDQLSTLGGINWRPMFGCCGIYHDGVFFAIIFDDRLFFRTDGESAKAYTKLGMQPLIFRERQRVNSYYEVPEEIIENSGKLSAWARTAIEIQKRRRQK